MEKYYSFAGIELAIHASADRIYEDARYLTPFAVDAVTDPHRFSFEMVDALTPPEGECVYQEGGFRVYQEGPWQVRYIGSVSQCWDAAYMRAAHLDKEHLIQLKKEQFPGRFGTNSVLSCIAAEHLVAQAGGFVFHSSYIRWQGRAILFTAPSGTGKSTQAELWRTLRGAEVINGDRSAVRVTDDGIVVSGIPFAGSSQICKNQTLPLAAIVYLDQAPRTSIRRLQGFEAFRRIWEGVSVNAWDKEDMALVSGAVERTAQTVPVFYLPCTPDETAVIALEQALRE